MVVESLYGIAYSDSKLEKNRCIFNAKVYMAADFYQMQGLKSRALTLLRSALRCAVHFDDLDDFHAVANMAYQPVLPSTTEICEVIVDIANEKLSKMFEEPDTNDSLLKALPEFAYDIIKKRAKREAGNNPYLNPNNILHDCEECGTISVSKCSDVYEWADTFEGFKCPCQQ